ncbi:glycosyltransferase family 4 protein [Pseudomonas sp. SWRI99]|uniref:MraY family glycosyltransferase n=1 Tax=Pseudomonas sp. SWRI99 TaxID=2745506 RepID=UPI00164466E2|nr:glycosyltransferase family 4 protein [Pseudomonas sp. SWRI99]MBC3775839.1 glycosyltransferase family 4 protein [Pseudomonas sp. SWRI99]
MIELWLIPVCCFISWAFTFFLRKYALAKSLMDIPNERSSHCTPTPRGGGGAIVLAFLSGLAFLSCLDVLSLEAFYALLGSGTIVAILGFADDHGHIAARWRLIGHFSAAAWLLFWMSGFPSLQLLGVTIESGMLTTIFALCYLVWLLNLYNFMDGIDGLASVEAISICLGMCLIYWFAGTPGLIWGPLLLACSTAGFLWWNFPPARIFMGDVGSGFLGIILGGLSMLGAAASPALFWSWIILLAVFITDATWTLLQRLLRKEKIYQAHRSHAYQHAAIKLKSHKHTAGYVMAINVLWLFPLAIAVAKGLEPFLGLLLAYSPLCYLAFRLRAGRTLSDKC